MNLSKFGVPIDGQNAGILHPKQKYRFRVLFQNFGNNTQLREMTASATKCTRPTLEFAVIQLDAYNSVAKIPGKHSWSEIDITLRDDLTNAVASAVGAQLQKQMNMYEQTSAVAGVNLKFAMRIDSLDGTTNEELESWDLEGCWISSASYSEGDYSSGDAQEISIKVQYDNAINLRGPNTNNGTTVGGNPFPNRPSPTGGTTFA